MDEFGIIAKYFAPLAGEGAFGLKDDAAILPARAGHDLVVTTDTISQGTDFFTSDPADTIAQKALRVNLSDLAAKGAEPAHYLLSLTLPHTVTQDWLAAFASGLAMDQKEFGISVLGGDTGAGELSISVTAFGFVPQGEMVKRSGAKAGDGIYVTGSLGGSILGRHMTFSPRIQLARELAQNGDVHAMIDVSDGLSRDLRHICRQSGLGAIIEADCVPIHDDAILLASRDGATALEHALNDGEDYELLFTSGGTPSAGVRVGEMVAGSEIQLRAAGVTSALKPRGWEHRL